MRPPTTTLTSGGSEAMTVRAWRRASAPWSRVQKTKPKWIIGPASWSSNSNSVTIAKLPPPPRRAQKRSGFSAPRPSPCRQPRSRTRAETRLSIASPCLRLSQPMPPPRVRPPMPVWLTRPTGTARPCSWVAASRAPSSVPPPTFARRASGSTSTWFIRLRSITRPSSTTHEPDMLWAPHRTADLDAVSGSEPHRRLHVRLVGAHGDGERAAVDGGVPDPASVVVRRITCLDDLAAQRAAELGDRSVRGLGHGVPPSACGGRCTVVPQHPPRTALSTVNRACQRRQRSVAARTAMTGSTRGRPTHARDRPDHQAWPAGGRSHVGGRPRVTEETLFWLQQPDIREDLLDGEGEHEAGETLSGEELRARYGLPPL